MRTIAAAVLIIVGVVTFGVIPAAQTPGTIEGIVKDRGGPGSYTVTLRLPARPAGRHVRTFSVV